MTTKYELPPLPGGGTDFSVDDEFIGVTVAQDKVVDALHKDGWTLRKVFTEPNAVLPLPVVKFPAGRVYLFADNVAVIVRKSNGSVIASIPTVAALQTLDQFTPEVVHEDPWAIQKWMELTAEHAQEEDFETHKRWQRQNLYMKDGARWTVRRNSDGSADITRDGTLECTVDGSGEAEDRNLHPVIVELVAYVLEEEV